MAEPITINVQGFDDALASTVIVLVHEAEKDQALALPALVKSVSGFAPAVGRVAAIERYTGKLNAGLVLTGAADLPCERLIVVGLGKLDAAEKIDFVKLGGVIAGKVARGAATVVAAHGTAALSTAQAADLALGMRLRAYKFDKYKTVTKTKEGEPEPEAMTIGIAVEKPAALRKALKDIAAVADGVDLARELVNEPPNILGPDEFSKKAKELKKLGVTVEVLDEKALKKIGMKALLGVGLGSPKECQVVIMRWSGAKDPDAQPVAFVGKGVTFDTGGISIKPAGGMEDMKGDMAGAACVVGLMHALASRKAKVNVIGAIGLVENMPDGKAQRPGDIVTSLSGQTIEIINTDAEGRLVLADVLWYVQREYKPAFMVNLATLTGAILVALGQEHAGLFSNTDELANRITAAGLSTGERVWRMPLDKAYDKIIDSKFADVKNSGGRFAGSITAAQFLQRFVNKCPWAHLDIAGTGMSSPDTDTNRSWGSGWGVRLLDRLVADHYEG
jgi:leucyl aminopeptidase